MMGSREYKKGDECDAFSRRARRIVPFRRGALRKIKRRYWKRTRANARVSMLEAAE